jgi:hypothetical protein
MRKHICSYFFIFLFGLHSCENESAPTDECSDCQINALYGEISTTETNKRNRSSNGKISNTLKAQIKRVVDEELNAEIGFDISNSKVTETYQKILSANPDVIEKANIYREVACSFERFYCNSKVLNDLQKHEKIEQILNEFRTNIFGLLDTDKSSEKDKTISPIPPEPKPTKTDESSRADPVSPPSGNKYTTSEQPHDIAILAQGKYADELGGAIRMELNRKGYLSSRNYFTSAFLSSFSAQVWNGNAAALTPLDLSSNLNCICTINSEVESRINTLQGRTYTELTGVTRIQLILLGSAESFAYTIRKAGSGPESDPNLALEDYTRKVFSSEEFSKIPFSLCK